jgi:hypothetical protein
MSRGTTRSTQRRAERRHPSKFFFVALAIGLALLIWLFVFAVRHPTKPQPPARRASVWRRALPNLSVAAGFNPPAA